MKLLYKWIDAPSTTVFLALCLADILTSVVCVLMAFDLGSFNLEAKKHGFIGEELLADLKAKHNADLLVVISQTVLMVLAAYAFSIYIQKKTIADPPQLVYYKVKRVFVALVIILLALGALLGKSKPLLLVVWLLWKLVELGWTNQLITNAVEEDAKRVQRLMRRQEEGVEMV